VGGVTGAQAPQTHHHFSFPAGANDQDAFALTPRINGCLGKIIYNYVGPLSSLIDKNTLW
jgi:hypothetical protein